MFKQGEIIGTRKLNSTYDRYVLHVIGRMFKRLPKEKKGAQTQYEVLEDTPTIEEYRQSKERTFVTDAQGLVDNAFDDIDNLKDELQEWFDNLPESFQSGDKGDQIQEAVDTLDSIERPDFPEAVPDGVLVIHYPNLDAESRRDRAAEASDTIRDVASELRALEDLSEEAMDEINQYCDELEAASDEIENVEFPGMYS